MLEMLMNKMDMAEEKLSIARLRGRDDLVDYYQQTRKAIAQQIIAEKRKEITLKGIDRLPRA